MQLRFLWNRCAGWKVRKEEEERERDTDRHVRRGVGERARDEGGAKAPALEVCAKVGKAKALNKRVWI